MDSPFAVALIVVIILVVLVFFFVQSRKQWPAEETGRGPRDVPSRPSAARVRAEESLSPDVLFSGQVYALHAQLGLFDAEDEDAYPEWETGEEAVVYGPKGVAVAVAPDREIEVTVGTGDPRAGRAKIGQGELKVGGEGLIVGNIVAASVAEIAYPAGRVFVTVYGNSSDPVQVTAVDFILTRATPRVRPPRR